MTGTSALELDSTNWTKTERRLLHRVNISRQRGAKIHWDSLLTRLPGRTKDEVMSQLDAQLAVAPPMRRQDKQPR
jgi:hypothetical protein